MLPQRILRRRNAEIARARERDAREEKAVSGRRGARRLPRDPLRPPRRRTRAAARLRGGCAAAAQRDGGSGHRSWKGAPCPNSRRGGARAASQGARREVRRAGVIHHVGLHTPRQRYAHRALLRRLGCVAHAFHQTSGATPLTAYSARLGNSHYEQLCGQLPQSSCAARFQMVY